jgi:GT2 family glycosyltransferase
MTIGIGICTYQRPEYLEKCGKAIIRNLFVDGKPVFDYLLVYNDGSDPKHHGSYERAYRPLRSAGATIIDAPENKGVATAKNALIEGLLARGCDWIFTLEDDILIKDPKAVTEYVAKATDLQQHHFSFAHHGPANVGGPIEVDGDIAYYPHSIGAWCLYSREMIEKVGLFDTQMVNAFEHVEFEMRAFTMGYSPNGGPHRFADVVGSENWLAEIPGAIEKSAIRPRPDWQSNIRNSLLYWRDNKPETFDLLFGADCPLQQYAQSIIG